MSYSRWLLTDLQVHTPADRAQRYGDVGGPGPNRSFAEVLIRAHADAGVRVIAVTDHNRLDWYPILAEVGREHGVTVFPGLEFNVNKCHLLAIWDCTNAGYQLGLDFLKSLFPPGESPLSPNREPRPTEAGSPLQLVRRAAHQ